MGCFTHRTKSRDQETLSAFENHPKDVPWDKKIQFAIDGPSSLV